MKYWIYGVAVIGGDAAIGGGAVAVIGSGTIGEGDAVG